MNSIAVFFLGGTISMAGHDCGAVVRHGGADLVAAVPQLADLGVDLDVRDFRALPSACLSFDDIVELAISARGCAADGIVVVQGTDTIEETAYLLDLIWARDAPIVVTGAMRNPTMAGADGPANLLAAVAVAASPRFRGLGSLVAFDDEVHAARYVRKTHSTSPATFASPGAGPVGHLVEGRPVLLLTPPGRHILAAPPVPVGAPVALITIGMDDDGGLLPGLADRYAGVVIAGLGAGHVPAPLAEPLGALAERMPVVLASRTGAGAVLSRTYGFAGSEVDLLARGLIGAGMLHPYKARVLLRVLLATGAGRDEIAAAFARAGGVVG